MELSSLAGLALISGTIIVYVGFGSFPSRIYTESNVAVKEGLIESDPRRWRISQALVALGSMVSVAGLALVTVLMQGLAGAALAWVGLVAVIPGLLFWVWHLALRVVSPQDFARGELPRWHYYAYSVLTLAGLAAYGIAFWIEGSTPLFGIGLTFGAAVVLVLLYVFKGMPPFVYYALTLAIGLMLLIREVF